MFALKRKRDKSDHVSRKHVSPKRVCCRIVHIRFCFKHISCMVDLCCVMVLGKFFYTPAENFCNCCTFILWHSDNRVSLVKKEWLWKPENFKVAWSGDVKHTHTHTKWGLKWCERRKQSTFSLIILIYIKVNIERYWELFHEESCQVKIVRFGAVGRLEGWRV